MKNYFFFIEIIIFREIDMIMKNAGAKIVYLPCIHICIYVLYCSVSGDAPTSISSNLPTVQESSVLNTPQSRSNELNPTSMLITTINLAITQSLLENVDSSNSIHSSKLFEDEELNL